MPRKKPAAPAFDYIAEQLRPLAEPIADLKPDPRNAREHGEGNLRAIAESLKQFGQRKPLVVNRATKYIESGNGLYLAAQQLGWSHLAVVWVVDDANAATGFALADNRTAELSAWDQDTLAVLLAELHGSNEELYDALAFEDLRLAVDEADQADTQAADGEHVEFDAAAAEDDEATQVPALFAVQVECADEAEQRVFFEEMQAAGRKCRLLTI